MRAAKTRYRPAILVTALVLLLSACGTSGANGPLTTEADEAYRSGDFERAHELYAAVLRHSSRSSYTNAARWRPPSRPRRACS